MPPKGYRHLSIREEVFKRLEEFAKSKGVSSLSDAIALLLDYADIYSKLE
jgi:predicted CopG family antitoxin